MSAWNQKGHLQRRTRFRGCEIFECDKRRSHIARLWKFFAILAASSTASAFKSSSSTWISRRSPRSRSLRPPLLGDAHIAAGREAPVVMFQNSSQRRQASQALRHREVSLRESAPAASVLGDGNSEPVSAARQLARALHRWLSARPSLLWSTICRSLWLPVLSRQELRLPRTSFAT